MTGTMSPYGIVDGRHPQGVPLYRSSDLKKWVFLGIMVARPDDSENKWYQERFWAPELFALNGKYYITVNCCLNDGSNHGMLLAAADNIEGPYTVLTDDKPLAYGNDAHLFADSDGKTYLFCSGICGAEIDLEKGELKTELKTLFGPVKGSYEWNGERSGVGFEGPYVIKQGDTYYMFYSTWARGYEVGIAYSKSPLDGWELCPEPIYGGINADSCIRYGGFYETGVYKYQDKYREAGHNCVFTGPDGEKWIAAHAYDYIDGEVKLVIDRIEIGDDGIHVIDIDPETGAETEIKGPTWGKRSVRISKNG
jgi:GH43 family beta-xylosidase